MHVHSHQTHGLWCSVRVESPNSSSSPAIVNAGRQQTVVVQQSPPDRAGRTGGRGGGVTARGGRPHQEMDTRLTSEMSGCARCDSRWGRSQRRHDSTALVVERAICRCKIWTHYVRIDGPGCFSCVMGKTGNRVDHFGSRSKVHSQSRESTPPDLDFREKASSPS